MDQPNDLPHYTGCDCKWCARERSASGPSDATACSLEVEISESRRRYLTIEVTPEMANRICEWTMKYNPTAAEEQAAIDAVKAARVIKEEIMHDTYEIGSVDFPENAERIHGGTGQSKQPETPTPLDGASCSPLF